MKLLVAAMLVVALAGAVSCVGVRSAGGSAGAVEGAETSSKPGQPEPITNGPPLRLE